ETSIQTNNRIEALAVGPDNLLYALQMSSPISIHRFTLDLEHADGGTAFQTLPGNASASADSAMTFDGDTLYVALGNAGGILRLDSDAEQFVRIANGGGFIGSGFEEGMDALAPQSQANTN